MVSKPPGLSAVLASKGRIGVVFRRGPSRVVQIFLWDRLKDKFKPGQLFRGRLYPERSDLSPDGKHLIYFAMAGVAWAVPETKGTWTAISRPPSLKATAIWGQGDTWGGGGFFTSNRSFWLNADRRTFLIRDHSGLRRETNQPAHSRLERDGWVIRRLDPEHVVLETVLRHGWILRRVGWHGAYELEQPGECKLVFPDWEWAEWDRERLVWTEKGYLRGASLGAHRLGTVRTIYDFNVDDERNPARPL